MSSIPTFAGIVGLATISFFLVQILRLFVVHLRPSRLSRFAHFSPDGDAPWALVTGASDGIGRTFAQELASSGFNVVVHGRNAEKLARVVELLQAKFPQRQFKTLIADASLVACTSCLPTADTDADADADADAAIDFASIQQQLSGLRLTVLVNNAGGGPGIYAPVGASPEDVTTANISLNALFPFHLTRALAPSLIRNGPSLLLNISSMSDTGFPLLAAYSASKAFLMSATASQRLEMIMEAEDSGSSDKAVEVLGIRVGRTTGTSFCTESPSVFMPSSDTMAKAALAKAGYGGGLMVGYWGHALQQVGAGLFTVLPGWVEDNVKTSIMRKQREAGRKRVKRP